ncbi:MAG: hypothetical protein VR72_02010 [Clostridiaceae bacterium BRH_c20a]|nr:MAG: hypothetical protein VR72_02010 [Clostridiaceae bacterium BRH_c20a]
MGIWDIVINNLKRRKGKVLFIITGITIGIATIVTLFSLTTAMNNKMVEDLEEIGTRVLLAPRSETTSFTYGGITVAQDVAYDIKKIPKDVLALLEARVEELNIKYIAPKKVHEVYFEGNPNLLVGGNINSEFKLKPWLKYSGSLPDGENKVLLGNSLAEQLAKRPGDTLTINNLNLTITGVLDETGDQEDNIILAPLALAESLSGDTSLSIVELVFNNTPQLDADINSLKSLIPDVKVTTVREVMESRKEVIDRYENFAFLVSVIVLAIAGLIVVTTMLGAVNERIKEIGIFRAIGFRKKDIMYIITLEAAVACGVGGFFGYVLGVLAAKGAAPLIETELFISWNLGLFISMITMAIIIGLIASLFPAVKAAQLDPQDALRYL